MDKKLFVFRINEAMKKKNISQYSLSKMSGINKGSLSSYMSGKYLPKQEKIILISKSLEINPDWLMCTSDIMELNHDVYNDDTLSHSYFYIDRSVSAGIPDTISGTSEFEKVELPDLFLGKYAGKKDIIVLRVNGDSMNRVIPDGAFVVVNTDISVYSLNNDDIVIFSDNFNYSMKRFVNDKQNKKYIFKPDSYDDCFEDIVFDYSNCSDLRIIGKVIMYNVSL